jgi:Uma2 family endonuclease
MTTFASATPEVAPPMIESGDQLTRAEFERRYAATPERFKAELIEGVVYAASPVSLDHMYATGAVVTWLGVYAAGHEGVNAGDNGTIRMDLDNEPQPDACLVRVDSGATRREGNYLAGAPELIVEVSITSASIDSNRKKHVYRRNGVQEYIVWRLWDRAIDWWALEEGEYVRLEADERGVIHSRVFAGLRLAVEAMLSGDMAAVLAELAARS